MYNQWLSSSIYETDSTIIISGISYHYNSALGYRQGVFFSRLNSIGGNIVVKNIFRFDSLICLGFWHTLIKDKFNNYIFTGQSWSPYKTGLDSLLIVRYDSSGNIIRSYQYSLNTNDSIYDHINSIVLNDSVLVSLVRAFGKKPYFNSGYLYLVSTNLSTGQVTKIDTLYKQYNQVVSGHGIHLTRNGKIIVLASRNSIKYIDFIYKTRLLTYPLFWELDSNLNIVQYQEYTIDNRHRSVVGELLEVDDGYVLPIYNDASSEAKGTPEGVFQGNVWKLDHTFSPVWECRLDTNGDFNPPISAIRYSPDSTFVVCGWDQDPQNMPAGDSLWITKGMIAKIGLAGNIIWQRRWAGRYSTTTAQNFLYTLEVLSTGDIIGIGSAQASQQDSFNAWIIRVGPDGCMNGSCENVYTTIREAAITGASFSLAPNPAKNDLFVYFAQSNAKSNYSGIISDASGKIIETVKYLSNNTYHQIAVSDYPPGVYYFTLQEDSKTIKSLSFVKE